MKRKRGEEASSIKVIDAKRKRGEEASSIKVIPWSDIHKRRKIDQGLTSLVFEAELKLDGRTVAIKEIFRGFEREGDHKEAFCEEARMMARLHHPNIVSLHGVAANSTDIDHDNFYNLHDLVMEYMPSGNLEQALQQDPDFVLLPWRSRMLIALQVAQALEYMHSLGIIHFDIRTPNMLLDLSDPTQPLCKLCDFGIATEKEEDMDFMHMMGIPGRIAPEVADIDLWPITDKVDVFTFGMLLYALVMGYESPYLDVIDDEQVEDQFFGDLERRMAVPERCFYQWRELMRDCLVCEAPRRPAFSEVAARLRYMLDPSTEPLDRAESCGSTKREYENVVLPLDPMTSDRLSFSTCQLVSSSLKE